MDEAYFRQGVYRMLRLMGYWPIRGRDATVCARCHAKILPPIGRPDILVLAPFGLNRVVETKFVSAKDTSFSFSEISEEQRKWLDRWMDEGGYGYLGIGVESKPSSLYIIDWSGWLCIEGLLRPYQESIPISLGDGKGYKIALREKGYDLVTLASRYKLGRVDGEWKLPDDHSLLQYRRTDG